MKWYWRKKQEKLMGKKEKTNGKWSGIEKKKKNEWTELELINTYFSEILMNNKTDSWLTYSRHRVTL